MSTPQPQSRSAGHSEERLIAAQEMAGVGSWEWDIESNAVTWSAQLYRNFGVLPEEFEPSFEGYMALVHPDDRELVASSVTTALAELGAYEFEHRAVRPSDGEVFIHHCTGKVLVSQGRATQVVGTNQDVTERRRVEKAVQEAYEREREVVVRLRELDDAKTKFVSSVSHELRTPLTSIIGYVDLLQISADEFTDEHKNMLDIVERNSERLLSLIENLLTQSRVESGSFKLNLRPTPLRPVVESAVRAMLPKADEKVIVLQVFMSPDLGEVMGDAEQLERLLLNLLTNALKFTAKGTVKVSARREGSHVMLTVSDTGIGIPPDEIPKLFSPFFRSSNTEQTIPGAGLGLMIVKSIVEEHDGRIEIQSTPGIGTAVTVSLPIAALIEQAS